MNLVAASSSSRPIATTLLALGLGLAGLCAYFLLPVSPLPNIDIPTIEVTATMAGASPKLCRPPWRRRWNGIWAPSPASPR